MAAPPRDKPATTPATRFPLRLRAPISSTPPSTMWPPGASIGWSKYTEAMGKFRGHEALRRACTRVDQMARSTAQSQQNRGQKKKKPPSSSSNFSICITSQGSQADWARWPMDEQMNNRNMSVCRQKRN